MRDTREKPEITENKKNEEISEGSGKMEITRRDATNQRKQIQERSET